LLSDRISGFVRRLTDRGAPAKPLIVYYKPPDWSVRRLRDCPAECDISQDPALLRQADAVIFHIPDLTSEFRLRKPRGQIWVASSQESSVNYSVLSDPDFMARFDYTMTYRLDSDFPTPYFGHWMLPELLQPAGPKDATAPAVLFASSEFNQSRRYQVARALMRAMEVHSYGTKLHNRDLAHDEGRSTKLEAIAHYKFTLAFENSIARDYVTEKFWDPLRVGSVPVYLGAPNVDEIAPADDCYIDVRRYRNPRQVAQYLLWLDAHPDEYEKYLAWKQRGFRQQFLDLIERLRPSSVCRLCMAMTGRRNP
jgi:hypothetical protein